MSERPKQTVFYFNGGDIVRYLSIWYFKGMVNLLIKMKGITLGTEKL